MNNAISYKKAVTLAKANMISEAIAVVTQLLQVDFTNEQNWKLAGLCYYQLGEMQKAEYCVKHLDNNTYQIESTSYQIYLDSISSLVKQKQYPQAIHKIKERQNLVVKDYQLLGAIYMLSNKKLRAYQAISKGLKIDQYNMTLLRYKKEIVNQSRLLQIIGRK